MKKIIFNKIKFLDLNDEKFNDIIKNKGLFLFPSGPGLANLKENIKYYESLKKADFVFFDSGLFVLLLRFFKNIKVNKFSGFKFLKLFLNYLKIKNENDIFLIDPNFEISKKNKLFLKNYNLKKKNIHNYIAPKYDPKNLKDKKLLKKLTIIKPKIILINIGGGTQEVLGLYLKTKLKFNVKILCTGGALSFLTGIQAPINNTIDKLYLGWLVRIIFNPLIFFKRYFNSFRLIPMVILSKINVRK